MPGTYTYITDQHATYLLRFTVSDRIDIFSRAAYKSIVTKALNYCIARRGLQVYAWVLMGSYLHMVAAATPPFLLSSILRDFRDYSSKRILDTMLHTTEGRQEWLLHHFWRQAQRAGGAEYHQLWQDEMQATLLEDDAAIRQQIEILHENPVKENVVAAAEHYLYSSAAAYAGTISPVRVKLYDLKRQVAPPTTSRL